MNLKIGIPLKDFGGISMTEFIVIEHAGAAEGERAALLQGLVDRYLFEQWAAVCRGEAEGDEEY